MRVLALAVATAALVAGPLATAADAVTDSEIRNAVLTRAEMLRVTHTDRPMVQKSFACSTEKGLRGCGRQLDTPKGSGVWPAGVAGPYAAGVSVASSPAGALAYLEDYKKGFVGNSTVRVEVSTPKTAIALVDVFGEGYLGSGLTISGTTVVFASCSGTKGSRVQVVKCIQTLLAAQDSKASELR